MASRTAEGSGTRSPRPLPAEEQAALLRVATLVAQDAPEERVFAAVAEQVARLLHAPTAAVLRFVGDERAVVVGVWREGGSRGMPINAEVDFERSNSALGRVRSTRRPARADSYEGVRGELPMMMRAIGLRSSVAAPVLLGEEAWGAIVASTTEDVPLAAGTEQRLAGFAEFVARAVAEGEARRALAASRLRMVEAADESRRRLERELHEGAQQHLVALALKLRVARARAAQGSELAGLLDAALGEVREASAALDHLARALHPAVLDERGLAAALQALVARTVVPVHLRRLPARRFKPAVETTAYLVVAEAVAGVAEHARAAEVAVTVADEGGRLVVEVHDDGGGGIGGAASRAGSALRGLADRAAALGGRLDVDSRPGGSVVRAELPVER